MAMTFITGVAQRVTNSVQRLTEVMKGQKAVTPKPKEPVRKGSGSRTGASKGGTRRG